MSATSAIAAPVDVRFEIERTYTQDRKLLFLKALSIVKHEQDAEDVLHNAVVRALLYAKDFQGRCSMRTWLSHIVVSESYQFLRFWFCCQKRPSSRVGISIDSILSLPSVDSNIEHVMLKNERNRAVRNAISCLKLPQREAIEKYIAGDMISSTGLSKAEKSHKHRAIVVLSKTMDGWNGIQ
jgi:RNA polymerase sigma factor (sigma-70 family)